MPREHRNTTLSRRHFDGFADRYDELFVPYIHGYEEMHAILAGLLDIKPESPTRLLELGVGTGNLTRLLLERFPESGVVGYDLSERMLEKARRKLLPFGGRVELRRGDISAAPYGGPFDAVVSAVVIHHVPPRSKPRLFRGCLMY